MVPNLAKAGRRFVLHCAPCRMRGGEEPSLVSELRRVRHLVANGGEKRRENGCVEMGNLNQQSKMVGKSDKNTCNIKDYALLFPIPPLGPPGLLAPNTRVM